MSLKAPISTIMTKDVLMIDSGDSLPEALNTFNNHSIRHAPVVHRGELVGMLSWLDVKSLASTAALHNLEVKGEEHDGITVREVMTPDPVSVQVGDTIGEVAQILTENEFHALPVLDGETVVGIVSTTDVIRYFLEEES